MQFVFNIYIYKYIYIIVASLFFSGSAKEKMLLEVSDARLKN